MKQGTAALYADRKMSEGFPNLGRMSPKDSSMRARTKDYEEDRIGKLRTYLSRLVDLDGGQSILVLGCGPYPQTARIFADAGNTVTAVEPVGSFVALASEYLGDEAKVIQGAAEKIPLPAESQQIILFEAVLEHVDSIPLSLAEIYRVLSPGGVLFLTTTNRYRFSFKGKNGEYRTPFFNWFPKLVKEGYVFQHLHYQPELANFSSRPAVHWLSYSDLCSRGRDAGFAQFYSPVDLMRQDDKIIKRNSLRRLLLPSIQRNPWLRALALTQVGGTIFMLKRRGFSDPPAGSVPHPLTPTL